MQSQAVLQSILFAFPIKEGSCHLKYWVIRVAEIFLTNREFVNPIQ